MDSTRGPLADRFMQALQAIEREGQSAVPAMTALFSPDATIDNAALTLAHDHRRGSAAVEAFWSGYARDLHGASTEFDSVTTGPEAIGLFWTTRRAPRDGGAGLTYHGATWLGIGASGTVDAMRGYYDTRELEREAR